jgi:uncharacterized CHY-type Zn-finger protein
MRIIIKGNLANDQTRCVHYQTTSDVVSIKLNCEITIKTAFCYEKTLDIKTALGKKMSF